MRCPKYIAQFDFRKDCWYIMNVETGQVLPVQFPTEAEAREYIADMEDEVR